MWDLTRDPARISNLWLGHESTTTYLCQSEGMTRLVAEVYFLITTMPERASRRPLSELSDILTSFFIAYTTKYTRLHRAPISTLNFSRPQRTLPLVIPYRKYPRPRHTYSVGRCTPLPRLLDMTSLPWTTLDEATVRSCLVYQALAVSLTHTLFAFVSSTSVLYPLPLLGEFCLLPLAQFRAGE